MYCEAERITDGNDKTALAKLFRSAGLPISDEPLYTSSTLNVDSWHALEPLGFITGDLLGAAGRAWRGDADEARFRATRSLVTGENSSEATTPTVGALLLT